MSALADHNNTEMPPSRRVKGPVKVSMSFVRAWLKRHADVLKVSPAKPKNASRVDAITPESVTSFFNRLNEVMFKENGDCRYQHVINLDETMVRCLVVPK